MGGIASILLVDDNPKFLQEILDKNNLQADEVIYIGNSEIEDGRMCDALGVNGILRAYKYSIKNCKNNVIAKKSNSGNCTQNKIK